MRNPSSAPTPAPTPAPRDTPGSATGGVVRHWTFNGPYRDANANADAHADRQASWATSYTVQIGAPVDHQRGKFVVSYGLRGGGRATHRDTMVLPVGVTFGGRILRAAAVSCARAPLLLPLLPSRFASFVIALSFPLCMCLMFEMLLVAFSAIQPTFAGWRPGLAWLAVAAHTTA